MCDYVVGWKQMSWDGKTVLQDYCGILAVLKFYGAPQGTKSESTGNFWCILLI